MLRIASKKCTAIQVQVKQTFRGGLKMSEVIIIGHDGTFATRLRKLMEEHHTTQKELAETLGIKQPSLSAIENRGNDLKISTMKKYVEAMGGKLRIDVELPTGKHIGFNV